MKKLLIVLALTLGFNVNASHLMGGYISVVQQGFTDTVNIQVTLFSDPQGVGNPQTLNVNKYELVNGFYQTSSNISLSQQSTGNWQGFTVTIYSATTTLSAGDYRFVYTHCCRGILSNSSTASSSNFLIGLDYKKTTQGTIPNSAPVLVNYLPVKWVTGSQAQSMLFAWDLDGDSVHVETDDVLGQYANGTFVPITYTPLNSYGNYSVASNGLIKWNPNTQGKFGTGFKISEYRNGQLIGVNRIQQVFQVEQGSVPAIVSPFNMTLNADSTITIQHDLLNGDSTYVGFTASNYQNAQLVILGATINKAASTTWNLTNLTTPGTYRGYLRVTGSNNNMDFPVSLVVTSTIGIEEFDLPITYKVYDWNGQYIGNSLETLKGFYIIQYSNNTVEKVFIQ